MVEDAITDPTRIAELLASELTGLGTGPLAAVEVVDADSDATPNEDGTRAYAIAYDEETVGVVRLYPDAAVVDLSGLDAGRSSPPESAGEGLAVKQDGDDLLLSVTTGAAVKRAVDSVRSVLEEARPDS